MVLHVRQSCLFGEHTIMTTDDFMASATISINSNKKEVWDALVNPVAIKQYMFGTDVESGWR